MNPTMLVKNAKILTMDDAGTEARSMLIRDGRIVLIDPTDQEAAEASETVDLGGRVVLPGFIDGHAHLEMLAYAWDIAVDIRPPAIGSIDALVAKMKSRADVTSDGQWILGQGAHYQNQRMTDGRYPNRYDLDRISTKHPIVCRFSFHMNVFNSKAMELLGITKETPDSEGGYLERDETGEPTGMTNDMWHVLGGPDWPIEVLCPAIENAQDNYLSHGVVGLCEFSMLKGGPTALLALEEEKKLKLRISLYPKVPHVCTVEEAQDGSMAARFDGADPSRLRLAGMKLFLDGGLTSKAAAMHEPYYGTDHYGELAFDADEYKGIVRALDSADFQIAVHAIGDRAIDLALDAFEALPPNRSKDQARHRVEHAGNGFWTRERSRRFLENNILPVPQAPFIFTTAAGYQKALGPERGKNLFPFRTMVVEDGFPVPGNSDAIGVHPKQHIPLFGIWCLMTRNMVNGEQLDQAECLDIDTALKMYTRYAARSIGREADMGSLEVGKFADFIVFDFDPRTLPVDAMPDAKVSETWVNGERLYAAS